MPVDIFRGDSWQILILDPIRSLRTALFYRASLRAKMDSHQFDTRTSIAIGTIEFVPKDRVSNGDGEAYRHSGACLEKLKKQRMWFSFPDNEREEQFNIIVQLIDALALRWTDKQALAVTGALQAV